jgi:DNA repair exonuclease SbcCD nuclease subunit
MQTYIIGDIHFGIKTDTFFIDYQIAQFNKIIDHIIESEIKNVIILGDVFDNRRHIDINTFDKISDSLDKLESLNVYIIIGNHDAYFKTSNRVNSISTLLKKYNFNIIDKIQEIEIDNVSCLFVPWMHKNNHDESLKTITNSTADYCFGHFAINDFYLVRGIKESNGIKQSTFKNFKFVFSGHFHLKDIQKNIINVGSFVQLNWNDYEDKKQIILLDSEKKDFKKIEIVDDIFEKIFITDDTKFAYKDEYDKRIIKIFVERKLRPKDLTIIDDMTKNALSCDVIDNTIILETINENIKTENITDLLNEVLDKQEKINDKFKTNIKKYINLVYDKTLLGSV